MRLTARHKNKIYSSAPRSNEAPGNQIKIHTSVSCATTTWPAHTHTHTDIRVCAVFMCVRTENREHVSLVAVVVVAASVAALMCPTSNAAGVNDIVYFVGCFCCAYTMCICVRFFDYWRFVYTKLRRFVACNLCLLSLCLPLYKGGCIQHGAKNNSKTK